MLFISRMKTITVTLPVTVAISLHFNAGQMDRDPKISNKIGL